MFCLPVCTFTPLLSQAVADNFDLVKHESADSEFQASLQVGTDARQLIMDAVVHLQVPLELCWFVHLSVRYCPSFQGALTMSGVLTCAQMDGVVQVQL